MTAKDDTLGSVAVPRMTAIGASASSTPPALNWRHCRFRPFPASYTIRMFGRRAKFPFPNDSVAEVRMRGTMASYQRHAKAFALGGIAAVVIALVAAIIIGRRPGYELPAVAFIAGGIAMLVSAALTWWGGRLGIGRAEIFLWIGLALVALAGVCVGIFGPV